MIAIPGMVVKEGGFYNLLSPSDGNLTSGLWNFPGHQRCPFLLAIVTYLIDNIFMGDELIRKATRDLKQHALLIVGLTFFMAFFWLDQHTYLNFSSPWHSFFYRTAVALIAALYLQSIPTFLCICILAPIGAARAMAQFVVCHLIAPAVMWLINRLKQTQSSAQSPKYARRERISYSLSCLFSPKHGAYRLHAVTQSLLFYA
jgi:hypothetical protein